MKKVPVAKTTSLLKKNINKAIGGFNGKAVLLFSGGFDSSLVALSFANAYPDGELYLLSIDNGVSQNCNAPGEELDLLKRHFPKSFKYHHVRKSIKNAFQKIGMRNIENDFTQKKYKSLLICLGCKLLMHLSAENLAYNYGIKVILDGYAIRQQLYPEQTEEFASIIQAYYQKKGLIHLSPLYSFLTDKDVIRKAFADYGLRFEKNEPSCMWADSFSDAQPEDIKSYTNDKLKLILNSICLKEL